MDLFSPLHLAVLAGIALLIFGPRRLPELGEGLGKTIRSFKSAMEAPAEAPKSVEGPTEPKDKE